TGSIGALDQAVAYGEHWVAASGLVLKWENSGNSDQSIGQAGQVYSDGTLAMTAPRALLYGGWYNYERYNDVWDWLPGSVACDLDSGSLAWIHSATPSSSLVGLGG